MLRSIERGKMLRVEVLIPRLHTQRQHERQFPVRNAFRG